MAIYVDQIVDYGKRGKWCHIITDGNINELHEFIMRIGIKRKMFRKKNSKHPHYDLRPGKRFLAIQNGAIEVSNRDIVRILRSK